MGTVCTALLTTVGTSFLILEGPAGSCVAAGLFLTLKGEGGGVAPGTGT
jgi:hypothetical protein